MEPMHACAHNLVTHLQSAPFWVGGPDPDGKLVVKNIHYANGDLPG
jgi:hypothetical protein